MVLRAANSSGCSPLRSLHLGFTRVGEAGLEVLSQLRGLTALSLEGEGVSGQSLQVRALCQWHTFAEWHAHSSVNDFDTGIDLTRHTSSFATISQA